MTPADASERLHSASRNRASNPIGVLYNASHSILRIPSKTLNACYNRRVFGYAFAYVKPNQ